MRAEQRQHDVGVVAAQPAQVEPLAADGEVAVEHAELDALRGPRWRPTVTARRSSTSAAGTGCWASTATAPGLMMPAFSVAISSTVSPR